MGDCLTETKTEPKTETLEEYIIRNQADIYRLAYSYVHKQEDALDIVQDSICKAMTNRNSLKKADSIRPWFYRIVVNTALDALRRRRRQAEPAEDVEKNDSGADDRYEDFDLKRALDRLPDDWRAIVVLRYFEDMTLEEIAGVLHQNLSTVKTRLYKSLRLLRVEMNETE